MATRFWNEGTQTFEERMSQKTLKITPPLNWFRSQGGKAHFKADAGAVPEIELEWKGRVVIKIDFRFANEPFAPAELAREIKFVMGVEPPFQFCATCGDIAKREILFTSAELRCTNEACGHAVPIYGS